MKILAKRIFAAVFDTFMLAFLFVGTHMFIFHTAKIPLYMFLVFILLNSSRDLLFGNASLGKYIMNLAVYDENWQKPRIRTLLYRSFLTT